MKISYLRHIVLPLLFLTVLFIIFDPLGLDLWCSDRFYFGAHLGWKYKHSWWAEQLIHKDGRYLIVCISATCLLIIAGSFFPTSMLKRYRRPALYLAVCIALCTGSVAIGKATINRHCPWDYSRYGGSVTYTSIFVAPDAQQPRGHGFPAGHASGAFSLMALYFIFYGRRPAWARRGLVFSLVLGCIYTFGQLVRGAHFISHSIATVAICWLLCMFVYCVLFGGDVWADGCSGKQDGSE